MIIMIILGGLRPIAAEFLAAPTPRCGRWGWWGGGTVFLAILHHIMVFHCFLLFFDGFAWF